MYKESPLCPNLRGYVPRGRGIWAILVHSVRSFSNSSFPSFPIKYTVHYRRTNILGIILISHYRPSSTGLPLAPRLFDPHSIYKTLWIYPKISVQTRQIAAFLVSKHFEEDVLRQYFGNWLALRSGRRRDTPTTSAYIHKQRWNLRMGCYLLHLMK